MPSAAQQQQQQQQHQQQQQQQQQHPHQQKQQQQQQQRPEFHVPVAASYYSSTPRRLKATTPDDVSGAQVPQTLASDDVTDRYQRTRFNGTFFSATCSPRRRDFTIDPEWASERGPKGEPPHGTWSPPVWPSPTGGDLRVGGRRRCHSAPPTGPRLNPITWLYW